MRQFLLVQTFVLALICWPGTLRMGKAQVPGGLRLPHPPAAMEATDDGLFILQNGLLAKFDVKNLKLLGGLRLLEPIPAAPQTNDPAERIRYFQEVARHLAPATMIVHKRNLIIVQGNDFLRIDTQKLTIDLRTNLVAPADVAKGATQLSDLFQPQRPPAYQVSEEILYLLRADEIVAIDLTTGKVVSRGALPGEMLGQPTVTNPVGAGGQG